VLVGGWVDMAKDIPISQRQITPLNIPTVQTSGRQAQALRQAAGQFEQMAQQSFKQADEFVQKSNTLARMDAQNRASVELNTIFNRNQSDPDQLQKEAANYLKGLEKDVPQSEVQNLRNSYTAKLDSFLKRSFNNRNRAMDQQHELAIRQNRDIHVSNLGLASQAIGGLEEGLTEEEQIVQATGAFDLAAQSLNAIRENSQIKKADGSFFFTPEQQQKMIQDATQFWMSETAKQWIGSQPDKIEAFTKWQENEVVFQVEQDGKIIDINLREQISPDALSKVDKDMVQGIKDSISLRSRLESLEEKRLEQVSDALDKDFAIKAQEGVLTVDEVDAVKNELEPAAFIRNRRLALEADPVNNGAVEAVLISKISTEKLDIAAEIENARFVDKTIDTATMNRLLALNERQKKGIFNPVDLGERFVNQSLGGLSNELGVLGSRMVGDSLRTYNISVQRFIEENGREPNLEESFAIADKSTEVFSLFSEDQLMSIFAKPKFMPVEKKRKPQSITLDDLNLYKKKTFNFFAKKHKGNKAAVGGDPEFLQDMKRLKRFEKLVSQRQSVGR
jgi:hypothetical protein